MVVLNLKNTGSSPKRLCKVEGDADAALGQWGLEATESARRYSWGLKGGREHVTHWSLPAMPAPCWALEPGQPTAGHGPAPPFRKEQTWPSRGQVFRRRRYTAGLPGLSSAGTFQAETEEGGVGGRRCRPGGGGCSPRP